MFKLSSFSSSTRSQSFSPLHCAVDNALIKTFLLVYTMRWQSSSTFAIFTLL